jgi:hypothetical protein
MRRGRASLSLEDGTFITDDCYCEDTGPGGTITYKGIRYEVVNNLWWSRYMPSAYVVKVWGK